MNRIILIGNGFDLAHGLETSYKHFIDDYWSNIYTYNQLVFRAIDFEDDNIKIKNLIPNKKFTCINDFISCRDPYYKFEVKNKFLHIISEKNIKNWVDIEYEYFYHLRETVNNNMKGFYYKNISGLNKEFQSVKELLVRYIEKQNEKFVNQNDAVKASIEGYFDVKEISENYVNMIANKCFKKYFDEYHASLNKNECVYHDIAINAKPNNMSEEIYLKKMIKRNSNKIHTFQVDPTEILFLNFNYTNLEKLYLNKLSPLFKNIMQTSIHIHGNIKTDDIVFGYGDELIEEHKKIEDLNENEFLENFKSTKYLESDNYKKLLSFIESDYYQINILGHSCGISDRTLLNTLFEHEHCVSIKPYYYQETETKDNYSEIVRNISRNFKDKARMRDVVVNKEYCKPLAQNEK